MKQLAILVCALALAAGAAHAQDAQTPADICAQAVPAEEPENRTFTQAEQVLEAGVDYRAVLCTGAGPVYVDLLEDYAPVTVNNFVFLAQQGYYNNTTFHRVIPDFMAQGGDPTATGSGDPGYQFQDEFVGFLNFDRAGWLAMANANRPEQGIVGTNGSQFFITTVPTPHLDFRHTIFGEVLEGQENVAAIEIRDPATATDPGTSLDTVVIITDSDTVETSYTAPEPATQDEIVAAFDALDPLLTPEIGSETQSLTTEEVVASAPESVQASFEEFLTSNNHQYRVTNSISACAPDQLPFMSTSYTLDAYATEADATAALAGDTYAEVEAAQGLTDVNAVETLPNAMYSAATTACDTDATRAATYWQRGRFVARLEITVPADSQATPDLWLAEVIGVRIYEPILSDVLRRELR